jgi:hypothetical protein
MVLVIQLQQERAFLHMVLVIQLQQERLFLKWYCRSKHNTHDSYSSDGTADLIKTRTTFFLNGAADLITKRPSLFLLVL